MADSLKSFIPQTRALSESEIDEPAHKKLRLDDDKEIDIDSGMEDTMASTSQPTKINGLAQKSKKKNKKRREAPLAELCSAADVLYQEIRLILGEDVVDGITSEGGAFKSPYSRGDEVEVTIDRMSAGGSGIGLASKDKGPWTIVVPFALPGEKARVRIGKNDRMHSTGEVLGMLTYNPDLRDNSRIKCRYFGTCAGCQYQMLSAETQLDFKKNVILNAYKTYSNLPETSIPTIDATVESPLVYGYRTKLTPHFERPPKHAREQALSSDEQPSWLRIGFNMTNRNMTMDIEECPIAVPTINEKYKADRKEIAKKILTYKKGVSLMYRDSLDTTFDGQEMMTPPIDKLSEAFTKHVCVTDQNATAREMVGDYIFEFSAGGFFQNNNAILPLLVDYVRGLIDSGEGIKHPTHLVDTYCGAGLFAITLSSRFEKVAGIELSQSSIASAKHNAILNRISSDKLSFLSGQAANIFATVKDFPSDQTVVVIDPPRKGCDEQFLKQLLDFRSQTVVYVSCNVHSQARDIGNIVRRTEEDGEGRRYRLESLKGFDLFPQTAHVESVALLRLY
ncbi:tRNA methyltransferase [Phlegmacium glaucopus]|nr:tRNA methyltransferase [Phlegmacium glaucopus]